MHTITDVKKRLEPDEMDPALPAKIVAFYDDKINPGDDYVPPCRKQKTRPKPGGCCVDLKFRSAAHYRCRRETVSMTLTLNEAGD